MPEHIVFLKNFHIYRCRCDDKADRKPDIRRLNLHICNKRLRFYIDINVLYGLYNSLKSIYLILEYSVYAVFQHRIEKIKKIRRPGRNY
jgi:hypothetical protein